MSLKCGQDELFVFPLIENIFVWSEAHKAAVEKFERSRIKSFSEQISDNLIFFVLLWDGRKLRKYFCTYCFSFHEKKSFWEMNLVS